MDRQTTQATSAEKTETTGARTEGMDMSGIGRTTKAFQVGANPAINTSAARPRQRIVAGILAPLAAATVMIAMTVSPALAMGDNAPNLTVAGYGVFVGANVFCDKAARTMTVSARTSTMQAYGYAGGMAAGPYDNGQWVRYNVWARDINAASWTQMYSWSKWDWKQTLTSTSLVERLPVPADLGTNLVLGSAGHNYQILVQIDWWTNKDNVANITPTYSQVLKTDNFNTYYYNPSSCSF